MYPGQTSKLSEEVMAAAATIYPKTDLVVLTGTTQIDNIRSQYGGGFSGMLILVPKDGNVVISASGNVAVTVTIPQGRSCVLVFSKSQNKWYAGAIS